MTYVEVANTITCTRSEFDALPPDQRFSLLTTALPNSTHIIRFHKGKQIWRVSFEAVAENWEPRLDGYGGRIRRPKKIETGDLSDMMNQAVDWLLSTEAGQKVKWASNHGAGI